MKNSAKSSVLATLAACPETATDLMTPNPISIRESATVKEAVTLLIDKGISAAPVIDNAGRAVGVVSQRDILTHDREQAASLEPVPEDYESADLPARLGEPFAKGYQVERPDRTQVRDIMTPMVFAVAPDCPAEKIIEQMLNLKVHRLFVVDDDSVLTGVISALDILKWMRS
jgi:CBS domain-containing protein